MALPEEKMVRHPGNVIADDAMARLRCRRFRIVFWHSSWMLHEEAKQGVERGNGAVAVPGNGGNRIEARREEFLQAAAFLSGSGGKSSKSSGVMSHVFDRGHAA